MKKIFIVLLFVISGCVSTFIERINNTEINFEKDFYIFLEPPINEKYNSQSCQKVRKFVSLKIYDFLKSKNINIYFIEENFSENSIRHLKNNNSYIILPTIQSWNSLDYFLCQPNKPGVNYLNSTSVNIKFYDVKNQKYSSEYNLNANDTIIFFITKPELIFEKNLEIWWKKYQK